MRYFSILLAVLVPMLVACGGEGSADGGLAGNSGDGGDESDAGSGGSGGTSGSNDVEFVDLTGKIRFANFLSDGTQGVDLDIYWGNTINRSEFMGSVPYGTLSDFVTPRRATDAFSNADEAQYFLIREGETDAATILTVNDEDFTAETVLTVAFSAAEDFTAPIDLIVSAQTFQEHELSVPPAGSAHVYGWTLAFDLIEDGNFTLVGADELCQPEQGDSGGANLGVPSLIPPGTTGLALFDANTEPPCATGATPIDGTVEAGHSYVLIGEAETYELEARNTVLLEVGAE